MGIWGCNAHSGRVYQGKGKQKLQWHYQLPAAILPFHMDFINLNNNTL